jgi:hypothetical protein
MGENFGMKLFHREWRNKKQVVSYPIIVKTVSLGMPEAPIGLPQSPFANL